MADLKISQLTGATTPLAGTEVLPIVQSSSTKKVAVSDLTAGRNVAVGAATSTVRTLSVGGSAIIERFGATPQLEVLGGTNSTIGYSYRLNVSQTVTTLTNAVIGSGQAPIVSIDNATKDITVSAGNLIQGTAAKGVNFTANTPAAGMTSQLLNWYEEGTWTPVISDGTNNATMSANSAGLYTRIGRQVTLIGQIETSSLGSVTGNLRITGLPFTNASGTSRYSSGTVGYAELLNITAGQSIGISINSGASHISLWLWDSAAGVTPLQASEWSADGTMTIQITYFV